MVHQGLVKARCLALESTFELEQPWPYDFDSPDSVEGGTVAPALEADGGTLFYFPLSLDIPNVFQSIDSVPQEVLLRVHEPMKILTSSGWRFTITPHDTPGWKHLKPCPEHILYHSYAFQCVYAQKRGEQAAFLRGSVNLKPAYDVSKDLILSEGLPNYQERSVQKCFTGPVVILRCHCPLGKAALRCLAKQLPARSVSWIPHEEKTTFSEDGTLQVTYLTGCGPISSKAYCGKTFLHRDLSTLFTLRQVSEIGEGIVAKGLLTYYCANFDEQGPTIEMISTEKSHRGRGFLVTLYYFIEQFCSYHWRSSGIHPESGKECWRIMVTSLPGSCVEMSFSKGDFIPITDRKFFSQYLGYDEHLTPFIRQPIPSQDLIGYFQSPSSSEAKLNLPPLT